ncbi:unnamed protein product [Mucor hiemalis]
MVVFFTKMSKRLSKSKWSKIYLGLAIIHTIVSIAILVPNLINALKIGDILSEVTPPSDNSGLPAEYPPKYFKVVMESIAFILLVAWRFWISVDSILQMNSLTVYASASFAIFSFGFSLSMIIESHNWLISTNVSSMPILPEQLINLYIQIALSCVEFVLLIPTLYAAYKVVADFGWLVYKKLGSSIELQRMYTIAQWFSLLLKIDVFFELTFIFIVLVTKYNWPGYGLNVQEKSVYVYTGLAVCLVLSLPLAREALSRESYWLLGLFLALQLFYFGFAVTYTYQTANVGNEIKDWYAFYVYLFTVYAANIVRRGVFCVRLL